ncbi:NADH-quinone oxidoreductase subunit K [candidate division WOR-3 bacterium]|nr:NADH-quinone oxidoreductase subunit K [candidate division WOR-3 bacterium]
MIYILPIILFLIALFGIVVKRNLIKIIISISIMEYAIFLFFALIGYRVEGVPPIEVEGVRYVKFVDPLPQALVLTAIVIGLATTALLVAIAVRIYQKYGTFDIEKMRKLKG